MSRPVVMHWGLSSYFGWGVYGLNLALNWAKDPDLELSCAWPLDPRRISADPLRMLTLDAFLQRSIKLQTSLLAHRGQRGELDVPLLRSLGNDLSYSHSPLQVDLHGRPNIGVVFFETADKDAASIARLADYQVVVCGSRWNEQVLRERGAPVPLTTVIQGIDPTLFHPAARQGLLTDRFLVFSGGKAELRKGQDLVLAAFSRFARTRPDALLVSAWHSPWPGMARSLGDGPLGVPVPFDAEDRADFKGWARAAGVAADQFLDLGAVPNDQMPTLLREMDVALFPNRAEGGTNLVAMETMACGVPAILSANTGHLDLITGDNCYPLMRQGHDGPGSRHGWGESEVDEIVEALERVYADRKQARRIGQTGARFMADFTWARTAAEMKRVVLGV